MEVILLEQIKKLGNIGDIVKVKNGYGRNYLIKFSKAMRATEQAKKEFNNKRDHIESENNKKRDEARRLAETLDNASFRITRQASEDGKLFGSVTVKDIALVIHQDKKIKLIPNDIHLPKPIKNVGEHNLKINLHPDVEISVNVVISHSDSQ
jgi:large subunit ribosomal protein L9